MIGLQSGTSNFSRILGLKYAPNVCSPKNCYCNISATFKPDLQLDSVAGWFHCDSCGFVLHRILCATALVEASSRVCAESLGLCPVNQFALQADAWTVAEFLMISDLKHYCNRCGRTQDYDCAAWNEFLVADEHFHDHQKVNKKVECNAHVRYDWFSMILTVITNKCSFLHETIYIYILYYIHNISQYYIFIYLYMNIYIYIYICIHIYIYILYTYIYIYVYIYVYT